tara:strand:- start:43 stop:594 length:552 start_codon:yes stop_codon:yes gene_type:complete
MATKTLAQLKTGRDFTDVLDSALNLTDGGTVAGATTLSSTLTANGMITTAAGGGFINGMGAVSGLTAVDLTASTTLAVATHSVQKGKYVSVTGDGIVITLPAVVVGASFIIVNANVAAGGLMTIASNASDKFLVDIAGAAGTDDKDIINTKATQLQYDYVKLVGLSADGWLIDDIRGTWVDQS